MKTADFGTAPLPRLLAYRPGEVPHATIETNRTCDLGCRLCYNLDRASTKSVTQVKAEVDEALSWRNVQAITLLGGEPTLHPGLAEVIAYVKSRGKLCQVLTNGRRLLADEDGSYLDGLVRAGVDRIQVHIDSGQAAWKGDLDTPRRKVFDRLEARKVHFGLSVTIYDEDRGRLGDLSRRYSAYRYFDGILAILGRDPDPGSGEGVQLKEEFEGLRRTLGVTPGAYVSSNESDDDVCWLIYLYFIAPAEGTALAVSPALDAALRGLVRNLTGREAFLVIAPPGLARVFLGLATAAECLIHPRSTWRTLRSATRIFQRGPRLQYVAIQEPPRLDPATGAMRLCRLCPDATIRNGRLAPVCLADLMDPLPGFAPSETERPAWAATIQAELEGRQA